MPALGCDGLPLRQCRRAEGDCRPLVPPSPRHRWPEQGVQRRLRLAGGRGAAKPGVMKRALDDEALRVVAEEAIYTPIKEPVDDRASVHRPGIDPQATGPCMLDEI